jgi:hypothetical protein
MARSVELRWAMGSGLGALALYALQVPGASGDKDGSEFTLALHAMGAPHPTGYPLYTVFGHLFGRTLAALGASWPTAANAFSALGGAVAVALAVALVRRRLPQRQRWLGALSVGVLFGLNPLWTYEAVLAEVYSWHLAWALGAGWLFVELVERLESMSSVRAAALWGALCGVGGAHHATAVLVAAPLSLGLAVAARRARRLGVREVVTALAAALGVLALADGFVAWRAFHPAEWQWPTLEPTWPSVFQHLTGGSYGGYFGAFRPSPEQVELLSTYLWPWLGLALLGMLAGAARGPRSLVSWTLIAATVLNLGFAFSYAVPDPSSYFLVPLAFAWVEAIRVLSSWPRSERVLRSFGGALAAGALLVLAWRWVDVGRQRRLVLEQFDARLHSMWADVPFERAFLVLPSDVSLRLVEYQVLRQEKPGVFVVNPLSLGNPAVRRRFAERHGFDPIEGLTQTPAEHGLPSAAQVEAWTAQVCRRLNTHSPLPVVLFVPELNSVRLLRKP